MSINDPKPHSDYDRLDPLLSEQVSSMPLDKAFATILCAAVFADDKARAVEMIELSALMTRIRTLKDKSDAERRALCDEIFPLMKDKKSREDRVRIAAQSVLEHARGKDFGPAPMPKLPDSLFAHACDIICSDLHTPKSEKKFLRDLSQSLGITQQRAQQIMDRIVLKNLF